MSINRRLSIICSVLLALFALSITVPTDIDAKTRYKTSRKISGNKKKKRRSSSKCSPAARAEGKRQAMELVRTQSADLCRMVGVQPATQAEAHATAQQLIAADGESDATSTETTSFEDEGEDLAELEREDDVTVDMEAFRSLWLSYVDDGSPEFTDAGIEKQRVTDAIMDWLGTRYHFGGVGRDGIDCSAFTRTVYGTVASIELPRTAAMQSTVGMPVNRRNDLRFGDLVFFHTRRHARVSHVGIYLGDNLFAHASSRYGVTISSLESTYYSKRMIGARRITESDLVRLASNGDSTGAH